MGIFYANDKRRAVLIKRKGKTFGVSVFPFKIFRFV